MESGSLNNVWLFYPASMADVINLNRLRKARARAEHEAQAAANRVKHGRTGAQKQADRLAERQRAERLDGAKLANTASTGHPGAVDHGTGGHGMDDCGTTGRVSGGRDAGNHPAENRDVDDVKKS